MVRAINVTKLSISSALALSSGAAFQLVANVVAMPLIWPMSPSRFTGSKWRTASSTMRETSAGLSGALAMVALRRDWYSPSLSIKGPSGEPYSTILATYAGTVQDLTESGSSGAAPGS